MKCPIEGCDYDDSEEMIKIHLELNHGYSTVDAKYKIKEMKWIGKAY